LILYNILLYLHCPGRRILNCEQTPVGCLYISADDEYATYSEAEDICAARGLHLASPNSLAEFEAFHNYMKLTTTGKIKNTILAAASTEFKRRCLCLLG